MYAHNRHHARRSHAHVCRYWLVSERLGCVNCPVRVVASRRLSHDDDGLPLGVSVSEVAHGVRDLVERVGPINDGGDIR